MNRPLRVLVVSHSDALWGAEHVLLRLAAQLRERGVELVVGCPPGSEHARAWAASGTTTIDLELPAHHGLRIDHGRRPSPVRLALEASTVLRSARRIARAARAYGIDVVHSNSLSAHVEVALAARWARRGAVVHLHDLVAPGIGRTLLGMTAKLGARVVAISSVVAECVPSAAVTILHNGLDADVFRPGSSDPVVRASLGAADGDVLVGVLGRLDPEKGVDLVVRATAAAATERPLRLAVIGAPFHAPSGYAEALERYAEQLMADRVRFVAPRDDIPDVMRALDVVVSGAQAEPFGLTLLEAQASGTPVAALRTGGIPDFVRDGETGLLADTEEELAAAISRLVAEPALGAAIAARARAMVCAEYTVEQQALLLVEIYAAAGGHFGRKGPDPSSPG